jgi:hypothetical protein
MNARYNRQFNIISETSDHSFLTKVVLFSGVVGVADVFGQPIFLINQPLGKYKYPSHDNRGKHF